MCASMELCAPWPSATIVITAPTPMIMPSIVSAVRILFVPSAFKATRKIIRIDMSDSCLRHWKRGELLVSDAPARHGLVGHDLAVAERHDARAVFGDVQL